jgi:hypothetical protein
MTVTTMKSNTWGITCKTCAILSKAIVATGMFLWAFGESAGRARAASELYRQGYVEEARRLMTENN